MPVKDTPFKESPFGAPKQSLWGESSAPRFMSSRPTQFGSSSTPQVQNTRSTPSSQSTQNSQSSPSIQRTYTTRQQTPSLFMEGVPQRGGGVTSEARRTIIKEAPSSRHLVSANASGGATRVALLSPGQLIEHERFGIGEVLRVEGTGENTKAHIRFKNAGEKQLLLKFARFRVLG